MDHKSQSALRILLVTIEKTSKILDEPTCTSHFRLSSGQIVPHILTDVSREWLNPHSNPPSVDCFNQQLQIHPALQSIQLLLERILFFHIKHRNTRCKVQTIQLSTDLFTVDWNLIWAPNLSSTWGLWVLIQFYSTFSATFNSVSDASDYALYVKIRLFLIQWNSRLMHQSICISDGWFYDSIIPIRMTVVN